MNKDKEYYISQTNMYFDTLDTSSDVKEYPTYSIKVIRWEWPPWLVLTGFGNVKYIDEALRFTFASECKCINRRIEFFKTNPYTRCTVTFYYDGNNIPIDIYEEFTFNSDGEITFIEAWWNKINYQGQLSGVDSIGLPIVSTRMSSLIPGINNKDGVDLNSKEMQDACDKSALVYDFKKRAQDFELSIIKELLPQIFDSKRQDLPY